MRCIAVDWSGAKSETGQRGQREKIWTAEAADGKLLCLEKGRTREDVINEIVKILEKKIQSREEVVIGLDFAFSFPKWYLDYRGLDSAYDLWKLAGKEGEKWLSGNTWPFWGRPGAFQKKPESLKPDMEFRKTDQELKQQGYQPKSVFQVYGTGSVGTGTVRGLPFLAQLRRADAAIWPFDASSPPTPMVIEIYPRALYGEDWKNLNKSDQQERCRYSDACYPGLDPRWRRLMVENEDAFDAGVSALVMSAHADDLRRLKQPAGPPKSLEGEIWRPQP